MRACVCDACHGRTRNLGSKGWDPQTGTHSRGPGRYVDCQPVLFSRPLAVGRAATDTGSPHRLHATAYNFSFLAQFKSKDLNRD